MCTQRALDYLKENNESGRNVSRKFGIAHTTFQRAILNGVPNRPGSPTVLTVEEERQIVGYCLNLQKIGFGLTKNAVNYTVMQVVQLNDRNHPFAEGGPGQAWWERFLSNHSELRQRIDGRPTRSTASIYSKLWL